MKRVIYERGEKLVIPELGVEVSNGDTIDVPDNFAFPGFVDVKDLKPKQTSKGDS